MSRYWWRTFAVCFFAMLAVVEAGVWLVRFVRRAAC